MGGGHRLRDDRLIFRLDRLGRSRGTTLRHVAAHEAVHQLIGHLGGFPLPRWFEEGLCVQYAGIPFFEIDHRLERLAAAGHLPTLAELEEAFRGDAGRAGVGYKMGEALVGAFLEQFGEGALRHLLEEVAKGRHFEAAFLGATGERLGSFDRRWRERMTPGIPLWLFLMLENLELTLLCFGAFAVVAGYIRYRWRREAALARLESDPGE
ncbi:MAG: hypothetical protein HC813_02490 [Planctomycetes bacterium]|nr:hypothetical protein [Planctomycetota bacterium]